MLVGIGKSMFVPVLVRYFRVRGFDVVVRKAGWNANMNMLFSKDNVNTVSDFGLLASGSDNSRTV